jgi:molybdopterin synthase sulfur carrier subunit
MTGALPPVHGRGVGDHPAASGPTVTVRYWAAARAAAGVDGETVVGATLAEVVAAVTAVHPGRHFSDVLATCAVLVGAVPVGSRDPATIQMSDGERVEFLPPFAGG